MGGAICALSKWFVGSIAFASGSHLALQTRYRQKLGVSADSSKCSDCQTRTRKVALVADERRVEIYRKIQREYSVELRNLKPWSFDVPILRPGQIVVMHPMLWHQVQPNNSSSDRFALYVLCMCVSLMVHIYITTTKHMPTNITISSDGHNHPRYPFPSPTKRSH